MNNHPQPAINRRTSHERVNEPHPQPAINRRKSHLRVLEFLKWMEDNKKSHAQACKHFGYRVDSMSRAISKYRHWQFKKKNEVGTQPAKDRVRNLVKAGMTEEFISVHLDIPLDLVISYIKGE